MSLSKLKKQSSKLTQKLSQKVKDSEKKDYTDDRFWRPTRDKSGNAFAIIRFLPTPEEQKHEAPWCQYFEHIFKGLSGKWYNEKSLSTFKQKDPVGVANKEAWDSGDEDTARRRKRKTHNIANIYVVRDSVNPENEGKVFFYDFPYTIDSKIQAKLNPPAEFGDEPMNPFDFWEGANFRMKITSKTVNLNGKQASMPVYDDCNFDSPSPLFDEDSKLEEVYSQVMSLDEFMDEEKYKSYEELEKIFNAAEGITKNSVEAAISEMQQVSEKIEEESVDLSLANQSESPVNDNVNTDEDLEDFAQFAQSNQE